MKTRLGIAVLVCIIALLCVVVVDQQRRLNEVDEILSIQLKLDQIMIDHMKGHQGQPGRQPRVQRDNGIVMAGS